MRIWKTARREIEFGRTLIMAILNTTPDSFSDGGQYSEIDAAFRRAEEIAEEGADIIDIGGESTRPGGTAVDADEEIRRVVPLIERIASRLDVPISIDTWKPEVAAAALDAGAEIVNDISGLRWDPATAGVAARAGAGMVLMHSRGEFAAMHSSPPVADIFSEVRGSLAGSIRAAVDAGVDRAGIVLDIGIGFGKTLEQNLQLLGRLPLLREAFPEYPFLVGASRKSFIGRLNGDIPASERLPGSLAAAVVAVANGADVLRVHDVRETVQAIRTAESIIAAAETPAFGL